MNYSTIYRTLGILLFITFQTITAHAQFSVKGTLVDSLTHESEPYATIRITLDKSPEKPVRMNVTDDKGKFQEKLPQTGKYTLQNHLCRKTHSNPPFYHHRQQTGGRPGYAVHWR